MPAIKVPFAGTFGEITVEKSVDAFRTISEVADDLDVPQHVLRFWETKFPQIKPMKRGGGRRYYRPEDVDLLRTIRHLLYGQGYTIRGVQRIFKEEGVRRAVDAYGPGGPGPEADELRPDESATGVAFEPETAEAEPDFAFEPDRPSAMRSQVAPVHSLPPHHRTLLEAALADLAECERLLVAAHP